MNGNGRRKDHACNVVMNQGPGMFRPDGVMNRVPICRSWPLRSRPAWQEPVQRPKDAHNSWPTLFWGTPCVTYPPSLSPC